MINMALLFGLVQMEGVSITYECITKRYPYLYSQLADIRQKFYITLKQKKPADYIICGLLCNAMKRYKMLCNLMQLHHAAHRELSVLFLLVIPI
jgi:hypothetical protein